MVHGMEHLLQKMAQQLDSMDQASLDSLWEKYAQIVNEFEPSKRWEEAVLILSFIQAKNWKNQLFNTQWAMRAKNSSAIDLDQAGTNLQFNGMMDEFMKKEKPKHKATILQFTPLK